MPDTIFIGKLTKGLSQYYLPFNIDNDAFPYIVNAYVWRGRIKRKRGTVFLGQLQVQVVSVAVPANPWEDGPLVLVAGAGNLITTFVPAEFQSSSAIVPGTISITVGANTYTEPATPDGTLVGAPGGSGTINYTTGAITIAGGGGANLTGTFSYYPGLPVMGLQDFVNNPSNASFPLLLSFDTRFSYQIRQSSSTNNFYNTTFYKTTGNPFQWSGDDFNQFWTTNYQGALWATNNVSGLNLVNATYIAGTGTAVITYGFVYPSFSSSPGTAVQNLLVGDILWFNEWAGGSTINGLTGTVTTIVNAALGQYQVTFTGAQTVAATGIAQLLTNSVPGQDGIKWYDGDPTNTTGLPTGTGLGWVNFSPPLTATTVSIDNNPAAKYYLAGALAVLPFKDRLLFFAPYIQASNGNAIQLIDTVLWSWNGTPYYTTPVPNNESSDITAYYVDETGKGGYLPAGISFPITTISNNEDVLLIGFGGDGRKTRFVYTTNDLQPFLFFSINSELPSSATFSSVALDKGAIDIGTYGIAMTDQQSSQRIDLDIPDQVFQIQTNNNGLQRVNAIRDFRKEWIYFSYPTNGYQYANGTICKFPTQTFLFNYRDITWAIEYEQFTKHGRFRAQQKYTWQTIPFATWSQWQEPWNSGATAQLIPKIIAGNAQGYVVIKGDGTGESKSGTIQAIANNNGNTQITSTNHCVTASNPLTWDGDYLLIQGMLGATSINNLIGKVIATPDANTFVIDLPFPAGTYLGLGTYSRLSQPLFQTKQFPVYWNEGRQVRLSNQKYLLDSTQSSQVTLNIYLSQNPDDVWNSGPIYPNPNAPNDSLVYSQILYTCPESTNIGLLPANTNLQMPTAEKQFQIWHRMNTSLIGDSFQVGITLSEVQMKNLLYATSEIGLHTMVISVDRGPLLA